jgi:hypothetical protein
MSHVRICAGRPLLERPYRDLRLGDDYLGDEQLLNVALNRRSRLTGLIGREP